MGGQFADFVSGRRDTNTVVGSFALSEHPHSRQKPAASLFEIDSILAWRCPAAVHRARRKKCFRRTVAARTLFSPPSSKFTTLHGDSRIGASPDPAGLRP